MNRKRWDLVTISKIRLNGLKLRAEELKAKQPRTTVPSVLDVILDEAGIKTYTDQELRALKKQLKEES